MKTAILFLKIALASFGGIYSTWALLEEAIVVDCDPEKQLEKCPQPGQITQTQFDNVFSISGILPGPKATGVSLLGYEMGGFVFMILLLLALISPGVLFIPVINYIYQKTEQFKSIQLFTKGAMVGIIAILFVFLLGLFKRGLSLDLFHMEMFFGISLLSVLLNYKWKINPAILVLFGAFAGYFILQ